MPRYLDKILACPNCKKSIYTAHAKNCRLKKTEFKQVENIWNFITSNKNRSQVENELMHQKGSWGRISDGSYEILASFARGNRTVDIACGEGFIEQLSPDTVGVDFSISALKKAKKNGAKYLVCASAENLPFVNDSFDLSISAGSIENIENPQKAIFEMARVSKIQIMTIHREFDFPLARLFRSLLTKVFNLKHQPVEKPLKWQEIETMLKGANLKIVFKGYWTLPVNYGKVLPILPVLSKIPSCFFLISTKISR